MLFVALMGFVMVIAVAIRLIQFDVRDKRDRESEGV
jgi:hypothetical protein